jgi:hypothetical protein
MCRCGINSPIQCPPMREAGALGGDHFRAAPLGLGVLPGRSGLPVLPVRRALPGARSPTGTWALTAAAIRCSTPCCLKASRRCSHHRPVSTASRFRRALAPTCRWRSPTMATRPISGTRFQRGMRRHRLRDREHNERHAVDERQRPEHRDSVRAGDSLPQAVRPAATTAGCGRAGARPQPAPDHARKATQTRTGDLAGVQTYSQPATSPPITSPSTPVRARSGLQP